MVEILVLGALGFAAFVLFAVLASVFGLIVWLVMLPFKMLGWLLKGVAFILALPFVVFFGVLAFLIFGAGMLVFLIPFLPVALLVLGAWWLVRRAGRSAATVTR